jgi:hypothetical protein
MKRTARVFLALLMLLLMPVACGKSTDVEPFDDLPPAPELPGDAVLYYWVVEGSPVTVDEVVTLYRDGTITYENRIDGSRGKQFMGPGGAEQLLSALRNAGFWDLDEVYRPGKGETPAPRYVGLAAQDEAGSHLVEWQEPAMPEALVGVATDLDQFAQVVKMSIR